MSEEKHESLTPEQQKNGRKEFLKIVGAGAVGLGAAAVLGALPAKAASFSSLGVQFPSATSDGSNPGDYFFFVRSDESAHGRLRYWKGGAAYDVLSNITDADIAAGAAISASKIIAAQGDYDYSIFKVGSNFTSFDNKGNVFGTPGTNASPVWNAVFQALKTTGGKIWGQPITHTLNTVTVDPNDANLYAGIQVPTGNDATNPIEFTIESAGMIGIGASGLEAPALGCIFDLTSAAVSGLSGAQIGTPMAVLKDAGGKPNQRVTIKGAGFRLPAQASNRAGLHLGYAHEAHLERVFSGYNVAFQSLVAPSTNSWGIVMPYATTGGEDQVGISCKTAGSYYGWAVEDYTTLVNCGALRCNVPIVIGQKVATYHPVKLDNFLELSCINSLRFDAFVQGGFTIDATIAVQWDAAGAFAKGATMGAIEVNPARGRGRILFDPVKAGVGVTDIPFWVADGSGGIIETRSSANLYLGSRLANSTTIRQDDYAIASDASGGATTVTLVPAGTTIKQFLIYKKDSSINAVTVAAVGSDTIEGAGTKSLTLQDSKIVLFSDGSGRWQDLTHGGI